MAVSIRLGQNGGYILAPPSESKYIEPPNPSRGYVFIGDPGQQGGGGIS